APLIKRFDVWRTPEAAVVPELRSAVHRAEHGGDRTNAAAADDVDLDAGFLDRAHRAGVVRAVGSSAGEQQGRPSLRRVGVARFCHAYSSWIVVSLRISNLRVPLGVETVTSSPSSLLRMARPIGDEVEIRPFSASASSGI